MSNAVQIEIRSPSREDLPAVCAFVRKLAIDEGKSPDRSEATS
jgi:hypothetical protein